MRPDGGLTGRTKAVSALAVAPQRGGHVNGHQAMATTSHSSQAVLPAGVRSAMDPEEEQREDDSVTSASEEDDDEWDALEEEDSASQGDEQDRAAPPRGR